MELTAQTTLRFLATPAVPEPVASAELVVPASLDVAHDALAANIPLTFKNTGESPLLIELKTLSSSDDDRFDLPPEGLFAPIGLDVGEEANLLLPMPLKEGAAGVEGEVALSMVFEAVAI